MVLAGIWADRVIGSFLADGNLHADKYFIM